MRASVSTAPVDVLVALVSPEPAFKETLPEKLLEADWGKLFALAEAHSLLPMLWWRARESGVVLPQPWHDRLRERFEQNVRTSLALAADSISFLRHLEAAGVRALAYKGPALAAAVGQPMSLRQSTDVDLLVSPDDAGKASEVFFRLGYKRPYALSPRQLREFVRNECEFDLIDGQGRRVDLHWNFVPRHYGLRTAFEPLWERRQMVSLGGAQVPTFSSTDTVLAVAIHGTKHLWSRLCWLWDLSEAMRQKDVAWEELLRNTRQAGAEGALAVGVTLAEDLLHAPFAPGNTEWLRKNPAAWRIAGEIRERLLNHQVGAPDADRWRTLLRLRSGWMARAGCVAGYLLTSGVEEWSAVKLPDALFPLYSAVRVARIVGARKSRV